MRKLASMVIGISVVAAALLLAASLPSAQAQDQAQDQTQDQAQNQRAIVYSVKFVCGLQAIIPTRPPAEPPVKPGNYATAVNIHNFHEFPVVIVKKAVVANPEGSDPGSISQRLQVALHPNQALEVDCTDIVKLFAGFPLPPFIKGFVEIRPLPTPVNRSPELSVVGVYTAKECHKFAPTTPANIPQCLELGELSLQVVPYRVPFTLP